MGEKVTLAVQLAPAAMLDPQVLVCVKPLVVEMVETLAAALPELVMVTV